MSTPNNAYNCAFANPKTGILAQSPREDVLLDWLKNYGVADAWKLAEPLATGEVDLATLDLLTTRCRDDTTELRDMGIRWLALSFEVMGMIKSGLDGAEGISNLAQSMKSYYMDHAAQQ